MHYQPEVAEYIVQNICQYLLISPKRASLIQAVGVPQRILKCDSHAGNGEGKGVFR